MPTSTTVKGLNINELTEAQYDAAVQGGVIGPNELSIITDLSDSIQVSTMPTADAGNLGDILQYVGATDATYTNGYFYKNVPTYSDPSATISQTAGTVDSISFETTVGTTTISGTTQNMRSFASAQLLSLTSGTMTFVWSAQDDMWLYSYTDASGTSGSAGVSMWYLEQQGFVVTGMPDDGDTIVCSYALGNIYNLDVNATTFATQETQSGSYVFTANTVPQTLSPTVFNNIGGATFTFDADTFVAKAASTLDDGNLNLQSVRLFKVTTRDSVQIEVGAYDAGGYVINSRYVSIDGLQADWGLTIDGTYVFDNTQDMDMNYTPSGIAWTLNSEAVDLTDYGITYTGTPVNNDALTVVFTSAGISGYSWEQIDVQPSSGGGQAIEYDDVDYVYGTDPSELCLYFELENLTTGDYYFYVKSKKLSSSEGGNITGFQTHKVSFHWDSTWNGQDPWPVVRAFIVSPVLEGDFIGSPNDSSSAFQTQNFPALECYFNDNTENKFGIKMVNWLRAQTGYFYQNEPAVYKVSKLYGGEAPITMTLNKIQKYDSIPNYSSLAGCGNTTPLVKDPVFPDKKNIQSYNVGSLSNDDSIALLSNLSLEKSNTNTTQVHFSCGCKYGAFVGDVVYNIDEGTTQQITKATGPFVNSRFYIKKSTGEIYVSFDSAAFAALQDNDDIVYMSAGIYGTGGATEVYIGVYEESQIPDLVNKATRIPFASGGVSPVFDTPTLEEYENVIQYIGETDANYTNGYFYKADGTVVTVPASITCTETSATGTTITCTGSNAENLIAAIKAQTGWTDATIIYYLNDQYNVWTYDADNNTFSWYALGGIPAEWIQYFTFSPAVTTGSISWKTSNAMKEHEELQNGAWVQKDVQAGGGLSNDATGNNSLSILGAGTNKDNCVEVGKNANASDSQATVVGRSAQGGYDSTVSGYYASGAMYSAVYGYNAAANYTRGIAYGAEAVSNAIGAIQVGKGTNADAGTMKVGLTTDGTNWANIELLTAAGLIPVERLAAITGLADGNYKLRLTISSGVPTLSWVAE